LLSHYKYTDKEVDKLCKSIVVLIDTREKQSHVADWLDSKKISWENRALKQGDYSFYLPENPELGIDRDYYFDREIMVERKHGLDEIAGNFTTNRARFEEELAMFPGKKYLLLENTTYSDIINNNYRSKLSPKAFLATLHTFNHRYGLEVTYMPNNQHSGAWIYGTFIYYLKNLLH
jgi:ERCC4-type nuclease